MTITISLLQLGAIPPLLLITSPHRLPEVTPDDDIPSPLAVLLIRMDRWIPCSKLVGVVRDMPPRVEALAMEAPLPYLALSMEVHLEELTKISNIPKTEEFKEASIVILFPWEVLTALCVILEGRTPQVTSGAVS